MALVLVFCTSGGKSMPMGNDRDVKKAVIKIVESEIRNQLAPSMYNKITQTFFSSVSYDWLKENINANKHNREVVKAVDKAMSKTSVSLKNIRTSYVQSSIKKSSSSADLMIKSGSTDLIANGKPFSVPISYTAQRNSDGDLHVEVQGIENLR